MATWPLPTRPRLSSLMRASSAISYVSVTASATIHTKGAWSELVASTPFAVTMVVVSAQGMSTSTAATDGLLDIGIGAAASETVLIPDLGVGFCSVTRQEQKRWTFPVAIPAGTRIAARLQSLIASDICNVSVDLYGGETFDGTPYGATVDALGVDAATSKGVAATSGTTNVFGSWVQLIASTTRPYRFLGVAVGGNASAGLSTADNLVEIGVGAAASETVLAAFSFISTSTEIVLPFPPEWVSPRGFSIPAESRIAARISSSIATRVFDIIAYGVA